MDVVVLERTLLLYHAQKRHKKAEIKIIHLLSFSHSSFVCYSFQHDFKVEDQQSLGDCPPQAFWPSASSGQTQMCSLVTLKTLSLRKNRFRCVLMGEDPCTAPRKVCNYACHTDWMIRTRQDFLCLRAMVESVKKKIDLL